MTSNMDKTGATAEDALKQMITTIWPDNAQEIMQRMGIQPAESNDIERSRQDPYQARETRNSVHTCPTPQHMVVNGKMGKREERERETATRMHPNKILELLNTPEAIEGYRAAIKTGEQQAREIAEPAGEIAARELERIREHATNELLARAVENSEPRITE